MEFKSGDLQLFKLPSDLRNTWKNWEQKIKQGHGYYYSPDYDQLKKDAESKTKNFKDLQQLANQLNKDIESYKKWEEQLRQGQQDIDDIQNQRFQVPDKTNAPIFVGNSYD